MSPIHNIIAEDTAIPKWKICLAVGGACVVGTGLYLYFRNAEKANLNNTSNVSEKAKTSVINEETDTVMVMKKHNSRGSQLFRKGDYQESIEEYTKAIEVCPDASETKADLSTIYQNRAAAYEHLKNYKEVIANCSEALKLNNRYLKALTRRARAAEMLEDLNLALEDLTAICIIEGFSNPNNLSLVDNLLKKIGKVNAQKRFGLTTCEPPSEYAFKTYLKGYCCDEVIQQILAEPSTDDAPSKYMEAVALMRAMDFPACAVKCGEVIEEGGEWADHARLLRATIELLHVRREPALDDLRAVVASESATNQLKATALVKISNLSISFNEYEEAKQFLSSAESLNDKNSDIYHQRGQMLLISNEIQEASKVFDKAVKLSPDFPVGIIQKLHTDYRLAQLGHNKTMAETVIKQFSEVQKNFPSCAEVYLLWCQILLEEERYSEAEEVLTQLLAARPAHPHGLVYRGMLAVQAHKDVEQAQALMRQALQVDPKCEMALEHIATISVQSGRLQEGMEYLDRAIPLSKSINEMAHYYSLRDAAEAQINVMKRLEISLPGMSE